MACLFPLWCIEGMKKSPKTGSRPLTPPIVLASTFAFEDAEGMVQAALNPGEADLYSRWSNPTLSHVEEALCELEGAEEALLTASGMSAIHAALMAALMSHAEPKGVLLVQHEIYGATHELVTHILAPLGIRVERANVGDLATAASTLPPRSVIYAELPTNPLIRLADIPAIREAAPDDALLVVGTQQRRPTRSPQRQAVQQRTVRQQPERHPQQQPQCSPPCAVLGTRGDGGRVGDHAWRAARLLHLFQ